jgi:divalent anion:Na+ symporter, DASS family
VRHKHSETDEGEAADEGGRKAPKTDHLDYAHLLGQVDLFKGLERVTLAKLAAHLEPLSYPSGSIIFRQAEPADAFYIVARGTVGVYVTAHSGTVETAVKILHAGAPFGEMALLTNSARAATIKVETDCEVLRLDRSSFLDLVQEHPGVALSIAATLSRRLAATPDQQDEFYAPAFADSPPQAGGGTSVLTRSRWRPGRRGLALVAALVILPFGWIVQPPAGLSAGAWHALIVLLAALPALALDALLEGVLALLIASAWVAFGVTAPGIALSGFASANWVFVVAALIIAAAISSTGLLYRFALESIVRIRGGFASEVMALSLAGLLMGPAVPNTTGRVIMIAPMLQDLVEALGYRPQSKAAAGLAMAALVGFGQMAAMFLTNSTTAVMVLAVLPAPAREDVNWITWALYAAPVNVVLFGALLASILWLYRPAERLPSEKRVGSLALQRALLGPISREEKIALGVGAGLIVGFMTEPLHGVDLPWIAVLAMAVLTATGLVTLNTLRSVNWNFALLYGVLISLATVFGQTRLDRWIADRISGTNGDLLASPAVFVIGLTVLCFAISLLIRWQAAAPLVTIALAPVASASGVHPFIVGLIAVIACNTFFFPYQSTSYLALYAGTAGKLFTHRQIIPMAIAYAAWTMVAIIVSLPLWRFMALI